MTSRSRRFTKTPDKAKMDDRLKDLIDRLAARAPAEDLTDVDVDREVQAVRDAARQTTAS